MTGGSLDADARVAGLRERARRLGGREARRAGESLRLVVFTPRLDETCGARAVLSLLRRLVARPDLRCGAVAWRDGLTRARLEDLGVPVHIASGWPAPETEGYESRLVELAALVGADELDVALVDGAGALPGAEVATRLEVPFVWLEGEPGASTADGGSCDARLAALVRRAAAVICGSDTSTARFELAAPWRRATIRPGIKHGEIAAFRECVDRADARRRLELPEEAAVVLCVAPVVSAARQMRLAEAVAALPDRYGGSVLALVGDGSSPYAERVRSFADRAGLSVRLTGVSEVDPYLWHRAADVYAAPASGPSLGAVEAMAFGTPVVATRGADVSEAVVDGQTGYLCDEDDVEDLADAIDRALRAAPEEREQVGRRGVEASRKRFGARGRAEDIGRLADALAGDPRALPAVVLERDGPAAGPRRAAGEKVSVLIPTLDAGPAFAASLEALHAQEGLGGLEVLVIDSGSVDDTVSVARDAGASVVEIPRMAFNHGRTRNELAAAARGNVLLSTVQDAMFIDRHALGELVERLRADPALAAVTPRQVPGPGADLHSRYWAWRRDSSPDGGERAAVDNVCAAVRRAAWEALRFRELAYGEDLDFGLRAVRQGWRTAVVPEVAVQHHHDREAVYFLRRAAAERLMRVELHQGLDPIAEAGHGVEALAGALPWALGQLERALDESLVDAESVALAPFVHQVTEVVQKDPSTKPPTAELGSMREFAGGAPTGVAREAVAAVRAWMVHALFDPWVVHFALAVTEPTPASEARTFVARLVAGGLGQLLGEATRAAPDAPLALRLRGEV